MASAAASALWLIQCQSREPASTGSFAAGCWTTTHLAIRLATGSLALYYCHLWAEICLF